MDTEYVMMNWVELGFLTPLEVAVVYSQPEVYNYVRNAVDNNTDLCEIHAANLAMQKWHEADPLYKYLTVRSALYNWDDITGNIKSRIRQSVETALLQWDGQLNNNWLGMMMGGEDGLDYRFRIGVTPENLPAKLNGTFTNIRSRYMEQVDLCLETLSAFDDFTAFNETMAITRDEIAAEQAAREIRFRSRPVVLADTDVGSVIQFDDGDGGTYNTIVRTSANKVKKIDSKKVSAARRALKRSYNFFLDHEREPELKLFVSGGAVEVSHPDSDIKFVLKRGAYLSLLRSSTMHSAQWSNIAVSIHTKTDIHLSDICVYIRDTPVLDQLMATIMLVESGLEEELIEKGNIKNINKNVDFEALALKSERLQATLVKYKKNTLQSMLGDIGYCEEDYTETTSTYTNIISSFADQLTDDYGYVRLVRTTYSSTGTPLQTEIDDTRYVMNRTIQNFNITYARRAERLRQENATPVLL